MARKAIIVKNERLKREHQKALAAGKKPHHPTKVYNRCKVCGRIGGYMRQFEMCRICVREHAQEGKIMGLRKSSW